MKDSSIRKVVILGSGPIVIGQACEFDYSGTQACKALMAEGLEVILINSNPATIMTDPDIASRVYIEPLKVNFVEKILEKEKPDALIPTLGGQTALNLGLALESEGVLKRLGIRMIGANSETIEKAEDREKFREVLDEVGAKYPKSFLVRTLDQGMEVAEELGLPIILRPNYTLGGGGGGIAYSVEEYKTKIAQALHESPTSEVLVEESIIGWKEYELEVMRDAADTFVVICSIENIDPCGVHTGDSITVAPQQTLSDQEYQEMRTEAGKILNAVGVETGGANVQFAVNPEDGERYVIEMNPRVSRSSALASKATGFPIAKIAALLAIGYRLDEIKNDITGSTPSCYEPALDYMVTKIPRFAFEKFPGSKDSLTTQMKSVGEVMGIGRNLKESLQKAILSLEEDPVGPMDVTFDTKYLTYPNSRRLYHLFQAFREGHSLEQVNEWTMIAPFFLEQIQSLVEMEKELADSKDLDADFIKKCKRNGFSDAHIALRSGRSEEEIYRARQKNNLHPNFYMVDTCAGEFQALTPYYYSSYWGDSCEPRKQPEAVTIFGSGPNKIGQGIEFDYSCVRSVKALQEAGRKVVMVNSNPETVSTDYDIADELFFEPLTSEHTGEVLRFVGGSHFVAQLGGQTPIQLCPPLIEKGFDVLGTSLQAMDLAEDRGQFIELCKKMNFRIPKSTMASSLQDALQASKEIGFPMMCRPSYVLGGRRMEIVENEEELLAYFERHGHLIGPKTPCLIDQFLERALEVDVDLICGDGWQLVGGIIEHIEAAGVHSGDSMGVLPPQRLKDETCEKIEKLSRELAEKMGVRGFLNLQLAVRDDEIFMIEANPRSSRSLPFIAKATGLPLVGLGVQAMLGKKKEELDLDSYDWRATDAVSVKGVVFPFKKFPNADSILGPEMKSTGESMGRGSDYSEALLKAFTSSSMKLPKEGEVFMSLRDKDKDELLPLAKELIQLGYSLSATGGTSDFLENNGLEVTRVKKVHEGRPNCVDRIRSGEVSLVINTTSGKQSIEASFSIRRSCVDYSIPCVTESDAAQSFLLALKKLREGRFEVQSLPKI